ncbi:MAG TPA: hypothetical protein PLJ21_00010 [Pseudobdellovibrionaceae bacterium]|nr:hypothetical protein [Pseudobdellovibrionaceae bacterium]
MDLFVQKFLTHFVDVARILHFPVMFFALVVGITLRSLIYYSVKRNDWFARQFEVRVGRFLQKENEVKTHNPSFYVISKKLLEKTFFETFENRDKHGRRNSDKMMTLSDRIFLVKYGCAWLVHDILKQIRFLKYGTQPPKLINITKNTFTKNPAFNKIFGIIPIGGANDFLNILPGLFVIGGIFGTFLGVMKGLPSLSGMDINNVERTKQIMDEFLALVSLSMGASVIGILFSVIMTLVNVSWSPDRLFPDIIDRFENALDLLWNYSHSNDVPTGLKPFDENKDPLEALAEASLNQEIEKRKFSRDMETSPTKTAS